MPKYLPPTVTVDGVCLTVQNGKLHVLLIKRTAPPLKHRWALPGGYVANGETTMTALERILESKTGVHTTGLRHLEQLYTFDWIGRDPRGHAVTVTYLGLSDSPLITESVLVKWFALDELPDLAFDHIEFINLARKRLASKFHYTNIAFSLLPAEFSFKQLQEVYQAVLGVELDKRNFRKKIMATGMLESTGRMTEPAAHRPAQLFKFKQDMLIEFQQFLT